MAGTVVDNHLCHRNYLTTEDNNNSSSSINHLLPFFLPPLLDPLHRHLYPLHRNPILLSPRCKELLRHLGSERRNPGRLRLEMEGVYV